jgi:hypothetical protein
MSPAPTGAAAARAVADWSSAVIEGAAGLGRQVRIDPSLLHRGDGLDLKPPGLWSPNRTCRMVRAADGWLAVNLPRHEDRELIPAWLRSSSGSSDPWTRVVASARRSSAAELLEQARLLAMAVSIVGEVKATGGPAVQSYRLGRPRPLNRSPRVIDLSSLWAGPLCAALLAESGAQVTRYESATRPDTSRLAMPAVFARLNARKAHIDLDFSIPSDRARLEAAIVAADVVVTSARPRAFLGLGLTPETIFAHNPGLIWVAITGYGWFGEAADRVGFGDDAAAAGGLVRWTSAGRPRFIGDAVADPLTGLAAAAATLQALADGGGVLLDAALAQVARFGPSAARKYLAIYIRPG